MNLADVLRGDKLARPTSVGDAIQRCKCVCGCNFRLNLLFISRASNLSREKDTAQVSALHQNIIISFRALSTVAG